MYITYKTAQYSMNTNKSFTQHYNPPKTIPTMLPKPDFMPTKLVCISDMRVIDGLQVNEGYCALSYSWNQSGSTFYDPFRKTHKRIDEGKHKIVYYENSKKKVKFVKFEGIVQQICQQFNIKYIWYDQMCINQDDKKEKHREIRKMHRIYSNAYCTVALVPEYTFTYASTLGLNNEEYFKRLWTLEETIKSEKLLFVGRDVHVWGDDSVGFIGHSSELARPLSELSVAQILYHAHNRRSTKEHDRVFALIHLFPELIQHILIDYNQPLEDLMIRFYGLLAKKDINILLFRNDYINHSLPIQKYTFLPSWTGVNGQHLTDEVTTSFQNYDIIGKTMKVTTEFVTNDQPINDNSLDMREKDIPSYPSRHMNDDDHKNYIYYFCVVAQLPGTTGEKRNLDLWGFRNYKDIFKVKKYLNVISLELKQLSKFMEIKKENLYWRVEKRGDVQMGVEISFYSLTEEVDDPATLYIILSEILFKGERSIYYPVIKKKQGEQYYKAIGCCYINCKEDIFSDCNLPTQTFSIQ